MLDDHGDHYNDLIIVAAEEPFSFLTISAPTVAGLAPAGLLMAWKHVNLPWSWPLPVGY
jgi:hypothetical protein